MTLSKSIHTQKSQSFKFEALRTLNSRLGATEIFFEIRCKWVLGHRLHTNMAGRPFRKINEEIFTSKNLPSGLPLFSTKPSSHSQWLGYLQQTVSGPV